jgi:hypothetical protein
MTAKRLSNCHSYLVDANGFRQRQTTACSSEILSARPGAGYRCEWLYLADITVVIAQAQGWESDGNGASSVLIDFGREVDERQAGRQAGRVPPRRRCII